MLTKLLWRWKNEVVFACRFKRPKWTHSTPWFSMHEQMYCKSQHLLISRLPSYFVQWVKMWPQPYGLLHARNQVVTLPKFNIAPEKLPSQKETSIPTIHFQVLCWTSGGISWVSKKELSFSRDRASMLNLRGVPKNIQCHLWTGSFLLKFRGLQQIFEET